MRCQKKCSTNSVPKAGCREDSRLSSTTASVVATECKYKQNQCMAELIQILEAGGRDERPSTGNTSPEGR